MPAWQFRHAVPTSYGDAWCLWAGGAVREAASRPERTAEGATTGQTWQCDCCAARTLGLCGCSYAAERADAALKGATHAADGGSPSVLSSGSDKASFAAAAAPTAATKAGVKNDASGPVSPATVASTITARGISLCV